MSIGYIEHPDFNMKVPINPDGTVHELFLEYLLLKKINPGKLAKNKRKVTDTTLRNIFYKLKLLLDLFYENGINPYEATYDDFEAAMHYLRSVGNSGPSIQTYTGIWKEYYQFLSSKGLALNMSFPALTELDSKREKDGDFLSHVTKPKQHRVSDNIVPKEWFERSEHFAEKVLTLKEIFQLYEELNKQDRVFGIIALTMFQTFLRIGGVLQFPKVANKLNPEWKNSSTFLELDLEHQELHYINKGQKINSCLVTNGTMHLIHNNYMQCDDFDYQERLHNFKKKYITSKFCKDPNLLNTPPLWLNKNGTPVSSAMIHSAFRKASKAIGRNVDPHYMRHSGATHLLMNYERATGLLLNLEMTSSIHVWLRLQLGHKDFETTIKYINTVIKLRGNITALLLLPTKFKEHAGMVPKDVAANFKKNMERHIEYYTQLQAER